MSDKSKISKMPDSDTISHEAASWLAQLDSGNMTNQDRSDLREWAGRSPLHAKTLRKHAAFWSDIDFVLEEGFQQVNSQKQAPLSPTVNGFAFSGKVILTSFAASFGLILWLGISQGFFVDEQPPVMTYEVAQGESRLVHLADGSVMHLNTGSVAKTDLGESDRTIYLLRGEAFFEVASDKSRPFVVLAGNTYARAVGTAFSIKLKNAKTELIVAEGEVAFQPLEEAMPGHRSGEYIEPPVIVAGQTAVINGGGREVLAIDRHDMERKLSWREGILIFEGETLGYVVDEVSRYADTSIVISDPALLNLKIGGTFRVGEIDALLQALELSFGVTVEKVNDQLVYLSQTENFQNSQESK